MRKKLVPCTQMVMHTVPAVRSPRNGARRSRQDLAGQGGIARQPCASSAPWA